LFNVCKEVNPNTFFVSNIRDINPEWFPQGASVGICGATSTPMWLMEEVRDSLITL
jgi:4-hydroxy-3-methylbut-2-enyl diphosphate reductase